MSQKHFQDYRLRITRDAGESTESRTYIVRRAPSRDIYYYSGGELPLCLSNLVQSKAAELRFALQDALTGEVAAMSVRRVLEEQWKGNPSMCPKVEVLP